MVLTHFLSKNPWRYTYQVKGEGQAIDKVQTILEKAIPIVFP